MSVFLDRCAVILATWFGIGFAPRAPGTFGTLAALPLVWIFGASLQSIGVRAIALIIVTVVALWATARTENLWQAHDDPRIVADEVAGITATLIWFPFDAKHVLVGVAIFRLLDIWKPGPIGYIDEEIPGARGTVLDDVLAGLVSASTLYFIFHGQIFYG